MKYEHNLVYHNIPRFLLKIRLEILIVVITNLISGEFQQNNITSS